MSNLQGDSVYTRNNNTEMVYQRMTGNIGLRMVKVKQGGYSEGYWQASDNAGDTWSTGPQHKLTEFECKLCYNIRENARAD